MYYLVTIQYNKTKGAENKTVPTTFETLEKATAEFHNQIAKDMKNKDIGWSFSVILDGDGRTVRAEKYAEEVI